MQEQTTPAVPAKQTKKLWIGLAVVAGGSFVVGSMIGPKERTAAPAETTVASTTTVEATTTTEAATTTSEAPVTTVDELQSWVDEYGFMSSAFAGELAVVMGDISDGAARSDILDVMSACQEGVYMIDEWSAMEMVETAPEIYKEMVETFGGSFQACLDGDLDRSTMLMEQGTTLVEIFTAMLP